MNEINLLYISRSSIFEKSDSTETGLLLQNSMASPDLNRGMTLYQSYHMA